MTAQEALDLIRNSDSLWWVYDFADGLDLVKYELSPWMDGGVKCDPRVLCYGAFTYRDVDKYLLRIFKTKL